MKSADLKWKPKLVPVGLVFIFILISQMMVIQFGFLDYSADVFRTTKSDNLMRYLYFGDDQPKGKWDQFQVWIDEVKFSDPELYKEFLNVNFSENLLNRIFKSNSLPALNITKSKTNDEFKTNEMTVEYNRKLHKVKELIEKLEKETVKWNKNKSDRGLTLTPTTSTKIMQSTTTGIQTCVVDENTLHGREEVNKDYHGYNYLENLFNDTEIGGRWRPKDCTPSKRVAIILPFRDRDIHLKQLLHNLIPKLRRQKVDYTFYLIEQGHGSRFNRGMMRNVGYTEASKDADYDCFIFNDVDTVIENDLNTYTCDDHAALHMGGSIDIFNYTLPYDSLIGGILSFPKFLFKRINGYSNFYFMWGAEDDDVWRRIKRVKGGRVVRPPGNVTYITTLRHERDPKVRERVTMLRTIEPFIAKDGLNTLNYTRIFTEKRKLFTWVYVKVNESHYHELLQNYKLEHKKEQDRLKELSTTTKAVEFKLPKRRLWSKLKKLNDEKNTNKPQVDKAKTHHEDEKTKDKPLKDKSSISKQTGDDKTKTAQKGDDKTKTAQKGDDKTKTAQKGDDKTKTAQKGDDKTKTAQTGDDKTKTAQKGDDKTKTAQKGDDKTKTAQKGDDKTKTAQKGDDKTKTAQKGDDKTKTAQTGADKTNETLAGDKKSKINPSNDTKKDADAKKKTK